ncbi:acyltransferase [Pelotalea chapellei]|uniref:acyltransferase n=1 Tax=Pelotalea chapellei TaxID=44671 RepID=UPI002484A24B|nr:acyltransferase [Pelotalea chapellei]
MLNLVLKVIDKFRKKIEESKYNRYQNLKIGVGTSYNFENLDGICPQLIEIGEYCVFAPKSVVLTHDASLLPTTGKYVFKPVKIGNRVFIGYGAVIMPGLIIGDDVVIGSNAVVTRDVPPGTVVAGIPAKVICTTRELAKKRESDLQEAVFDWRNPVTLKEIVAQQKQLMDKY